MIKQKQWFSFSLLNGFILMLLSCSLAVADEFSSCLQQLQLSALAEGVPKRIVEEHLAAVQHVERVIELDRRQPEFSQGFGDYFSRRVNQQRITKGRELFSQHRVLLTRLLQEYGVPPQYLVAFWGLETNYGSYLGNMPILDSLATLACDQRRSHFFTAELLQALRLLSQPGVNAPMLGSWAGAMGQTQFMPSAYRKYARDGDGDGRIDLWNSVPDALTSAAYFLNQLGWQREFRWGREVLLPADYNFDGLGLAQRQPLKSWRQQGFRTVSGGPVANSDILASLLVPAGHQGPAFLVYDNFRVIMRWNYSQFYALSVGHLADRIKGAGGLARPPATDLPPLSVITVKALQLALNEQGFDVGEVDGIIGPGTRKAIRGFQRAQAMIADGFPHPAIFKALNLTLP